MTWGSYGGKCSRCGEYSEYMTKYCGECAAEMYALDDDDNLVNADGKQKGESNGDIYKGCGDAKRE